MSNMIRENDFGRMLDFLQEKTEPKESKLTEREIECPYCDGEGVLADGEECEECGGSGYIDEEERPRHEIDIEAQAATEESKEVKDVLVRIVGGEDEGKSGVVPNWVKGLGYQDVHFEGRKKQIGYEYLNVGDKSAEEFDKEVGESKQTNEKEEVVEDEVDKKSRFKKPKPTARRMVISFTTDKEKAVVNNQVDKYQDRLTGISKFAEETIVDGNPEVVAELGSDLNHFVIQYPGVSVSVEESKQTNEKEEKSEDDTEVPQTMKAQEKPNIDAEDFRMEDYSEEDLEKIKDEPPIEGPAMTEVPEEAMIQDPEKLYSSKNGLYLCNDCCKTFSGKESCVHCKSENIELLVEGYDVRGRRDGTGPYKYSAQRSVHGDKGVRKMRGEVCPKSEETTEAAADVGFTKEVYQVWYNDTDTGKEDSTRVMAFDEADAKKVAKKLNREIIRVEKIKEGKVPDDKDPEQKKTDKLTEQEMVSAEDIFREQLKIGKSEEDAARSALNQVYGGLMSAVEKNTQDRIVQTTLKKWKATKESKLTEGVSELIGEVTGIDTKDQGILQWALDNGFIDEEWPPDEVMIDALETAEIKPEQEPSMDLRAHYLFYILLLKAKQAHRNYIKAKESKKVDEGYEVVKGQEFLYAGAPYKIVDFDPDLVTAVRTDLPEEKEVYWSRKGLELMFANPEEHGIGESKVEEQEEPIRFDLDSLEKFEDKDGATVYILPDVDFSGDIASTVEDALSAGYEEFLYGELGTDEGITNKERSRIWWGSDVQDHLPKRHSNYESKVEEKLPDGTKFKFNYSVAKGPEKVMKDLAGMDMLKSAMVGSRVTLVGPRGTPSTYAKDEDKEWKPWVLGGFVEESKTEESVESKTNEQEEDRKRWVYGTRTNKWYLVGPEDRDYKYGLSQVDMDTLTPEEAKKVYLGPQQVESKLKENESGLKEAEDTFRTVAKGIEDRSSADEVARREKGQVVADDEDSEKWMVIVRIT